MAQEASEGGALWKAEGLAQLALVRYPSLPVFSAFLIGSDIFRRNLKDLAIAR